MAAKKGGGMAPKPANIRDAATRAAAKAAVKEVREAIREAGTNGRKRPVSSPKAAPVKVPARRWVWGPFAISGGFWALGWAAGRSDDIRYTAVVVGLPLLLAAVLGTCQAIGRPMSGVDRPAEVGYVLACMSGLSGWAAAAAYGWWAVAVGLASAAWCGSCTWLAARPGGLPTWAGVVIGSAVAVSVVLVVGPMTTPARWLAAWAVGTTAAGIPWWMHRSIRRGVNLDPSVAGSANRARRGAQVNATWVRIVAAAQDRFEGLELATVKATGSMSAATVKLPPGVTWTKLAEGLRELESAAGLRTGSLTAEEDPGRSANRAVLSHTERDPHTKAQNWPGRVSATITDPLAGGVRTDGTIAPVVLSAPEGGRNALVGGARGAGKSTWMNAVIAEAMACGDAVNVGIDTKGRGIELGPWFTHGAMPFVARDIAEARGLLTALLAVTQGRGELIRPRGRRKWHVGPAFDSKRNIDGPWVGLWADEVAQVHGIDPYCAEISLALAQLSRYAQVSQILATQFPKAQSIGDAALRGQMDIRIAFRHGTENEAAFTLDGYSNFGDLPAGSWYKKRPGTYLLVDGDDRDSVPVRSYQIAESDLEAVAKWRAEEPVLLDEESYQAALNALPTILTERAGYMNDDEVAVLDASTRSALHAMTYPARTPARQPATPAPASVEVASASHPPAPATLADATPPASTPLADGLEPPAGMDHGLWLAAMAELDDAVGRQPATRTAIEPAPRREGVPNTSPEVYNRVRLDLEGIRQVVLEMASRPEGVTRRDVMDATGKGRTYVQDRLAELREDGLVAQDPAEHGRWRAVLEPTATDRD